MTEFNVLSLFDGISCDQQALHNCGIPYTKYYASEIDQRAIAVTQRRWPKTIQFGDVSKIKAEHFMSPIHLLMGGSPCQGFSFAGKQLNFDDPRSKLFFEFVRLKNELQPTYFFLENVRMSKASEAIITEHMGVEPIFVNSRLVSAQNRQRLYWTNIPGFTMPEDRGILIYDILEYGNEAFVHDFIDGTHKYRPIDKASCFDANYHKGIDNNHAWTCIRVANTDSKFESRSRVYSPLGKMPTLTACCGGDQEVKIITHNLQPRNGKGKGGKGHLQKEDGKTYCLDTGNGQAIEYGETYRKLTVTEYERGQGLPDGYTSNVSKSAAYHAIGNGWQVDTIMEFFKHLPK